MEYHWHHIIPRHAGGGDDEGNLFELSTVQHALAHRNRAIIQGQWQDWIAWKTLSGQWGKEEATRRALSMAARGNKWRQGKQHSTQTKLLIKEKRKIQRFSKETKIKMSGSHKGKTKSAETRAKMSKAQLGNKKALGHKQTAEHKANSGAAIKAAWARRKAAVNAA